MPRSTHSGFWLSLVGCTSVGRPGGQLRAAAGAAEYLCRGDAGPGLPAATLLSPMLHGGTALL